MLLGEQVVAWQGQTVRQSEVRSSSIRMLRLIRGAESPTAVTVHRPVMPITTSWRVRNMTARLRLWPAHLLARLPRVMKGISRRSLELFPLLMRILMITPPLRTWRFLATTARLSLPAAPGPTRWIRRQHRPLRPGIDGWRNSRSARQMGRSRSSVLIFLGPMMRRLES